MIWRGALLVMLLAVQTQTAPPSGLTPQEQIISDQIGRLYKEIHDQYLANRVTEARQTGDRILTLFAQLRDDNNPERGDILLALSAIAEGTGHYLEARRWTEQRLAFLLRIRKQDWWQVADARLAIAHLDWMIKATPADRARMIEAFRKRSESEKKSGDGPSPEAVKLAEEALAVDLELHGPDHPYTASAKHALAASLASVGEDARAQKIFEEVLALRTAKLGRAHPFTSNTLRALGNLHRKHNNTEAALQHLEEALRIKLAVQGINHGDTIWCLNDLAELAHEMGNEEDAEFMFTTALGALRDTGLGESAVASMVTHNLGLVYLAKADYPRAETLLRRAIELKRSAIGDDSHAMATGLGALAELYVIMGDDLRALPLSERALEILRKVAGPGHTDTSVALVNLAAIYARMGDVRAVDMLREAGELIRKQVGSEHPYFAGAMRQMTGIFQAIGDYESAESLERQALQIYKEAYGDRHHWTATSTLSLANIRWRQGDKVEAESLYRTALDIRRAIFGSSHPDTADALARLGHFYVDQGDAARADPVLTEALATTTRNLELASALQSERQQIVMSSQLQSVVLAFVELAARGLVPAERAWESSRAWKGMVLARQRAMRAVAGRPDLQKTFEQLQQTTSQLASVAFSTPAPNQREQREQQLASLSQEKERLEAELSRQSAEFRSLRLAPPLAAIRRALPADAVLVDFFQYVRVSHGADGKTITDARAMAFVVPQAGVIHTIDLGPRATISRALDLWLPVLESGGTGDDAGRRLRTALWEPIERVLPRSGHVIISPDGLLARVPFAALPGRAPGTYLLEDRAISIIPSPQLLTDLASPYASSAAGLLAIGDVNYDTGDRTAARSPSRGRRAASAGATYERLPGTRGEIDAIQSVYRTRFGAENLQVLSGSAAIEDTFRARAPNQRYLHLATHGFFAPESFHSALDGAQAETPASHVTAAGFHPGLLSGLVLAGANKPGVDEDGILTSEEVATLDLSSVDLAVLSACETGLGQVAGGEGLLGLQRAFQTAGVRTVVATMWKVDDEATRVVMERFYDNLWNKRMGKREALREAQLWMLRDGRKPPFYWAAFVLSGDWR